MNHNAIYEPCQELFLSDRKGGIVWMSGVYSEESPFDPKNIVWVSIVLSNAQKQYAGRLSLMALN